MTEYIWESDNKKWAITKVEKDKDLSVVGLKYIPTRKSNTVFVEHVRAGDVLLDLSVANTDENRVMLENLPKYVTEKIIELTT